MTSVVVDLSMSLDGYITAAHQTTTEPMGMGGEVLHDWGKVMTLSVASLRRRPSRGTGR